MANLILRVAGGSSKKFRLLQSITGPTNTDSVALNDTEDSRDGSDLDSDHQKEPDLDLEHNLLEKVVKARTPTPPPASKKRKRNHKGAYTQVIPSSVFLLVIL